MLYRELRNIDYFVIYGNKLMFWIDRMTGMCWLNVVPSFGG